MPAEHKSENLYRQHLPNGLSFDLIYVKSGSYFFGDSDIEITLPDFYIGQYPVTQALWQAVMSDNPSYFKGKNRPVESISWYDAAAFCNALNVLSKFPSVYFRNEKLQKPLDYEVTRPLDFLQDIDVFHNPQNPGYRLPSETQWEYAARGGIKHSLYKYLGSNKLEEVGWYRENSHNETKPVGLKAPNVLDIYELSGNVWEWCADQWHEHSELQNIPKDGSAWVDQDKADDRVDRGGSWHWGAQDCRAAYRYYGNPSYRCNYIGFRVVLFPHSAPKKDL